MEQKTSDLPQTKAMQYDALLATVPSEKGSMRCGKGNC